jgi:small subunit ribosomal protein S9
MVTKETKIEKTKKSQSKESRYFEAVGRRKNAIARVRITPDKENSYVVNDKKLEEYFPSNELQNTARESLLKSGGSKFSVSTILKGGGTQSQALAMRLGIARALIIHDEELRGELKRAGFLKRDPRIKERKKFGLKKARKAPQWSKR